MNRPYLLQRMSLYVDKIDESARLSQAFNSDYMGSSEFEWGAIPKAYRKCLEQYGVGDAFEYETTQRAVTVNVGRGGGEKVSTFMRIIHPKGAKGVEEYIGQLLALNTNKQDAPRLKEYVEFASHQSFNNQKQLDSRLYWDIENQVFICFNSTVEDKAMLALKQSVEYVSTLQ